MLYLGCSQWNYEFWNDTIYSEKTKTRKHPLYYYSKRFNCVELNSTYYRLVDKSTLLNWKSFVNPDFKFCPKFPKTISHDNRLLNVEKLVDEFIKSISVLEDNLGISYLQLPPLFLHSELHLIDDLLCYINGRIKVSIEIRPEWLPRPDLIIESLTIIKKHKAGIVMVDSVETIKHLNNLKLTNSSAFIRFLSYNHKTDFQRIMDWTNLIKFWQEKGIKDVYFMLHFSDGPGEPPIVEFAIEKFKKN